MSFNKHAIIGAALYLLLGSSAQAAPAKFFATEAAAPFPHFHQEDPAEHVEFYSLPHYNFFTHGILHGRSVLTFVFKSPTSTSYSLFASIEIEGEKKISFIATDKAENRPACDPLYLLVSTSEERALHSLTEHTMENPFILGLYEETLVKTSRQSGEIIIQITTYEDPLFTSRSFHQDAMSEISAAQLFLGFKTDASHGRFYDEVFRKTKIVLDFVCSAKEETAAPPAPAPAQVDQ